ncbi:MAG: imidazole glycerol phosphate synthase cyclase subunit [Pseudomonadota bacterium]
MLKVRVIPTLLWKGFGLVKGVGFNSWRRVGSVLPALKVYNTRDVDELILVDITASLEQRAPDHDAVADFSDECFVPLTIGGGINNLQQIVNLLRAGADKICVNSATFDDPQLVDQAASRFGAQCVVVSIDVRRQEDDSRSVFTQSGTRDTGKDPCSWAREMADRGAGEILLTSIDRDGTMSGYDLALVERVTSCVDIPVIASGGAGNYQHMVDVIKQGGASAVAAASMFHFTEQTPAGAKKALQTAGIPVRQAFIPV